MSHAADSWQQERLRILPMKYSTFLFPPAFVLLLALCMTGCKHVDSDRAAQEAPPSGTPVVESGGTDRVHVEGAGRFQLAHAVTQQVTDKLDVTGAVSPDVSREIPVLSLANGRVVALHVGLGDTVRKGQLVMEVQSPDVATAFGSYLKAVSDEHLTQVTLERDKLLYDKGAIAQSSWRLRRTARMTRRRR